MKIQYNYSCFDSDYFQRLKTSIFVFIFNLFSVEFFISSKNRTEISTKPKWTFAGIHFHTFHHERFLCRGKTKHGSEKKLKGKRSSYSIYYAKEIIFFARMFPANYIYHRQFGSQAQNVMHVERVDNSNAFGSPHLGRHLRGAFPVAPLSIFRFRPTHLYASQAFDKLYVKNWRWRKTQRCEKLKTRRKQGAECRQHARVCI